MRIFENFMADGRNKPTWLSILQQDDRNAAAKKHTELAK
jgi:hypothetical protein